MPKKLVWDQIGEREFYTGVENGVVYPISADGTYPMGAAWNGLISVTETPSGAEPTALWANNRKYGNLYSSEEFGGSIEAYMYPDEFGECNGAKTLAPGVKIGQQKRKAFGLSYRNNIGNDTEGTAYGYELHIVYNAMVSPSEQTHTTINDSPEAETLSWEFTTTPLDVEGYDPTSHFVFKSTDVDADKLAALEKILYGSDEAEARLPLPAEVLTLMGVTTDGEVAG